MNCKSSHSIKQRPDFINCRNLTKENILGKCFRSSSSCAGPRISPLTAQYGCPRPSLSIITSRLQKPTKARPRSSFVIPCTDIQAPRACFEHSNFFKVTGLAHRRHSIKSTAGTQAALAGRPVTRLATDRSTAPDIRLRAF